jgi:hypothetical protein
MPEIETGGKLFFTKLSRRGLPPLSIRHPFADNEIVSRLENNRVQIRAGERTSRPGR